VTPEAAFLEQLEAHAGGGESDLRLAYESVGRSTRALADVLSESGGTVTQRTVQRWLKFEQGAGGEGRNPARSAKAGDIRAMADAEREARAIARLSNVEEFDSDSVDVEAVSSGDDEGARHAQTMVAPLDLKATMSLYQSGAPMHEVGRAFAYALETSYGIDDTLRITDIHGLTLR
jgi:hypothetical protein